MESSSTSIPYFLLTTSLTKKGGTREARNVRKPATFPLQRCGRSKAWRSEVGARRSLPLRGWKVHDPSHTMKVIPLIPRIVCLGVALGLMMPLVRAFDIVQYKHPGLKADLGVGLWAWPVPLDYDQDGDYDLIVSCPDVPHNGTFFLKILLATSLNRCSNQVCASAKA